MPFSMLSAGNKTYSLVDIINDKASCMNLHSVHTDFYVYTSVKVFIINNNNFIDCLTNQ